MDRSAAVVFGVLTVVTVVVAALLLGASGPSEPTQPEPTPTVTPTAEPPDTSTPTATTTTTEPTPEPTTTDQIDPEFAVYTEPLPDTVYTREIDVSVRVTNNGPSGEYTANLTIDRQNGAHYDATRQIRGEVGPNDVRWFNYTVEVGATGTYTVSLDNREVGTVEVRALGSGGDSTTEITPKATASGKSNTGAK